ncbi:MAG: hypothetical protein RLZZ350_2599 [Verrucomicrobiota bacterium]|jgi:YegS/Rv2252/BmrU family lipid kinase
MHACVIFNPTAKGDKARRLQAQLDLIAHYAVLKKTSAAGDARRLAAEAIAEGCTTVIAAGGDGTVNEVLNGIGDANAFARVRLGVLPLGTINVFARELGIPLDVDAAWQLVVRGRYTHLDLPCVDFSQHGQTQRRYFVQLGGAGLDARAIELVNWEQKKKFGPLAYVLAGWRALRERQPKITVVTQRQTLTGEFVLLGNGELYGGRMKIFPTADLRDGLLDVCVFPRVGIFSMTASGLWAAVFGKLPPLDVQRVRSAEIMLTSATRTGFELDGDFVGCLPAKFSVAKERLRVIVP